MAGLIGDGAGVGAPQMLGLSKFGVGGTAINGGNLCRGTGFARWRKSQKDMRDFGMELSQRDIAGLSLIEIYFGQHRRLVVFQQRQSGG